MQHLKVQVKCQPPAKMMQGANTNQTPVVPPTKRNPKQHSQALCTKTADAPKQRALLAITEAPANIRDTMGETTEETETKTSQQQQQQWKQCLWNQASCELTKQIQSEEMPLHASTKTIKARKKAKLIHQFGFIANPNISTLHNTSETLTTMPAWY